MAASALVVAELSGSQAVSTPTGVSDPPFPFGLQIRHVDQARLDNHFAHRSLVAARQHVVAAQQVLRSAAVLNQSTQRSAATIRDVCLPILNVVS